MKILANSGILYNIKCCFYVIYINSVILGVLNNFVRGFN